MRTILTPFSSAVKGIKTDCPEINGDNRGGGIWKVGFIDPGTRSRVNGLQDQGLGCCAQARDVLINRFFLYYVISLQSKGLCLITYL